jgi:hypothetical protein
MAKTTTQWVQLKVATYMRPYATAMIRPKPASKRNMIVTGSITSKIM